MKYLNFEIGPIWAAIKNPKLILPKLWITDVTKININKLKGRNIKAIIFDLDQTLCEHEKFEIFKPYLESFMALKENFKIAILSNPPRSIKKDETVARYDQIESIYNVPVILSPKKKPNSVGYMMALEKLKTRPENTAMVGDRVLTDILGANICNIYTILVNTIPGHIDPSLMIKIPRKLERLVLNMIWGK